MDHFVIEYALTLETMLEETSAHKNGIQAHLNELERNHKLNYGIQLPTINFRKNNTLEENQYQLVVKGKTVSQGIILPHAMMAIPPKHNKIKLPGVELQAPLLDIPVIWIPKKKTKKAKTLGFALVSPLNVLMQHIEGIIILQLDTFFNKTQFLNYTAQLPAKCQEYLSDIMPKHLSFRQLLTVFRLLLAEKVSIRDSGVILQAILEAARTTQDTQVITEHVRGHLARQITASYLSGKGYLPLIPLSEEWENEFKNGQKQSDCQLEICLDGPVQHAFHDSLGEVLMRANAAGETKPVILTRPSSRRAVQSLMSQFSENIPVVSQNELHGDIELKTVGWIS